MLEKSRFFGQKASVWGPGTWHCVAARGEHLFGGEKDSGKLRVGDFHVETYAHPPRYDAGDIFVLYLCIIRGGERLVFAKILACRVHGSDP